MPDATPATAPHSAFTGPSGSDATLPARLASGELRAGGGAGAVVMSRGGVAAAEGA
jgi:hypothetical protein